MSSESSSKGDYLVLNLPEKQKLIPAVTSASLPASVIRAWMAASGLFWSGNFRGFFLTPTVLSTGSFRMEVFLVAAGSFAGVAFFLSAGAFACASFGGRPLCFGGSAVLSGYFFTVLSGFASSFPLSGTGTDLSGVFPFSASFFSAMIFEKL